MSRAQVLRQPLTVTTFPLVLLAAAANRLEGGVRFAVAFPGALAADVPRAVEVLR